MSASAPLMSPEWLDAVLRDAIVTARQRIQLSTRRELTSPKSCSSSLESSAIARPTPACSGPPRPSAGSLTDSVPPMQSSESVHTSNRTVGETSRRVLSERGPKERRAKPRPSVAEQAGELEALLFTRCLHRVEELVD